MGKEWQYYKMLSAAPWENVSKFSKNKTFKVLNTFKYNPLHAHTERQKCLPNHDEPLLCKTQVYVLTGQGIVLLSH